MAKITVETRQLGAGIVVLAGLAMILSGLVNNPWVSALVRGPEAIDHSDVLYGYFWWSLSLGAIAIALGRMVARGKSGFDGLALSFLLCAGVVLGDRWLLTKLGLTIWKYDAELHYVHRPGAVRTLSLTGRPGDLVRINSHGFHDDEFPRKKPKGELRGLMLGDSVTMGYGVTYEQTFSRKLEELLARHDRRHRSHQIINAGVHGYSTYQERVMFERNLDLQPDFVTVGFCMNDVTEPFVVNTKYGGTGIDYHGVMQTANPLGGFLANETGLGRLLQKLGQARKSREEEKRREIYDTRKMAIESRTNRKGWSIVLDEMAKIYALAKAKRLPIVLLIFPFTYQLNDPATHGPQEILIEHAQRHGVDAIDFTPLFAEAVYREKDVVELLARQGKTPEQIARFFEWRIAEYFFDEDHFREPGHALVAQELYRWLERRELVSAR